MTLRDREGRVVEALVHIAKLPGGHIAVKPVEDLTVEEFLDRYGRVPIPPYIRDGQMVDEDIERYQTVYAREAGSVAADRGLALYKRSFGSSSGTRRCAGSGLVCTSDSAPFVQFKFKI